MNGLYDLRYRPPSREKYPFPNLEWRPPSETRNVSQPDNTINTLLKLLTKEKTVEDDQANQETPPPVTPVSPEVPPVVAPRTNALLEVPAPMAKKPANSLLDYWSQPVIGKMPLDQFVQIAGTLGHAFGRTPTGREEPMGILGAGLAQMGGAAYAERVKREQEELERQRKEPENVLRRRLLEAQIKGAEIPTEWQAIYGGLEGKTDPETQKPYTPEGKVKYIKKLTQIPKEPKHNIDVQKNPNTGEWEHGRREESTGVFTADRLATDAEKASKVTGKPITETLPDYREWKKTPGNENKTYEDFKKWEADLKEREVATSGLREFETVTGINPAKRGTPEYSKSYMGFLTGKKQATQIADPIQQKKLGTTLRKEFNALQPVKDYRDIETRFNVMGKAIEESKTTKNFVAVDQALITIFNKMTDPQSVVRESEYLRTPQDLALWNRIKGKVLKMVAGGAGLTSDDRNALFSMAKQFQVVYESKYNQLRNEYRGYAVDYGLDPETVIKGNVGEKIEKTVIKKFYSESTGKTKYVYSDGTEEIK